MELRTIANLQLEGREARVVGELRQVERRRDVAQRLGLERPHHDDRAIAGLEHAGKRHCGPVELAPAHQPSGAFLHLRSDHRIKQRHGDELSAPGLLPLQQCEQDALHEMHTGRVVGKGGTGKRKRHRRVGSARHHAAHRLRQNVLTALVGIGSGEPIAGAHRIDQPRIEPRERFVAEAHAVHHAGAEVADDNIAPLDQPQRGVARLRLARVEDDRALVAVERAEHRPDEPRRIVRDGSARQIAGARPLDLDHVGAVISQHLGGARPHHHLGEVDDLDAVERQRLGVHACTSRTRALADG